MPEVEELTLELTDVSDDGFRSVATLPRLRKLVVYGGRHSITDSGLDKLQGQTSLEILELKNTHVTNGGLYLLQDFPNLRVLTLDQSPPASGLTDAGLVHLRQLPKLEHVTLVGIWASSQAVAELQAALPNCKVETRRDTNDIAK